MFLISRVPVRGSYTLIDLLGIKMTLNTCTHVGKEDPISILPFRPGGFENSAES